MKTILSILSVSLFLTASSPALFAQSGTTNTLPLVTLRAARTNAISESGITNAIIVARETTNVTSSLTVLYTKGGGASNGVDYLELPASITIPEGMHNVTLPLVAIDDAHAEATENIILTLRPSEFYRTNSVYKVTIPVLDNDNLTPTVHLVSPTNDSVFFGPTNVPLRAEAGDSDGTIRRVEFYRNATLLGIVTNPISGSYHFTWTNAQPGTNTLTARAMDNFEARGTSAPVRVVIQQAPVPTNTPPTVTLLAPSNNTTLSNTPANVSIIASAGDADGYVRTIEFLDRTNSLVIITNQPGTGDHETRYQFDWTNVPPGEHVLWARATDNGGKETLSEVVFLNVIGTAEPPVQPIVTIAAIDPNAAEVPPFQPELDTATFTITRRENTNVALTVYYTVSGSASNGVDYAPIYGSVKLPSGTLSSNVVIRPLDDSLVESNETVIITLSPAVCAAVFPPPPECYRLGAANEAVAIIRDNSHVTNQAPTITLFSPTNGSVFTLPTNILLRAEAHDSDGNLQKVEFYRNNILLGTVSNQNTALFQFNWTNAQPGSNMLVAKAVDNLGLKGSSEPVFIQVNGTTEPPPRPIVTIVTTDGEASEISTIASAMNTATFTIARRENTNVALTVHYQVTGTASNGVDYVTLPGSVTLPSGKLSTNLVVRPFDDTLVESNETVVVTLSEAVCIYNVFPLPPECYLLGEARQASAVIIDNDHLTNQPPVVSLRSPTNNSIFLGPLNIPVEAEASDADGKVVRVDFFAGDHLIGSRTNSPYTLIWSNVAPATYSVSVKAMDDKGAVRFSAPSKITVQSFAEHSFVRRTLPLWYVPGVRVRVQLRAEPRTNTTSYALSDIPPAGWVIQLVGDQGSVSSGKVSFGPFNDAIARTFFYDVTPPANESGEKRFQGTAIANGIESPIIRSIVMNPAPAHPADRDPMDWNMSTHEAAAYGLAWKRCERWPLAPNPIPVSYATRAGFLVSESGYGLSTLSPTPFPPMLWEAGEPGTISLTSNHEPWTTNRLGTAISSLPTNYVVGVPFTATIVVTPTAGVRAYALEETPPFGFSITNITEGGLFCPLTRKIRWGVFSNAEPITVSYQLMAATNSPSVAKFAGVLSCNGINQPITGRRETTRNTSLGAARLEPIRPMADGNRLLTFPGEPGVSYILEGTTDFNDWTPIAELLNSDGALQFIDPSTDELNKFYRAVRQE